MSYTNISENDASDHAISFNRKKKFNIMFDYKSIPSIQYGTHMAHLFSIEYGLICAICEFC